MKLIHCPACNDDLRLWSQEPLRCHCGSSWGHYLDDDLTAVMGGISIPLCISQPRRNLCAPERSV